MGEKMSDLMIAMYHYTRDLQHGRYPRIKGMDIGLFREQLLFFKEHFCIVTMEDVIASASGAYSLPKNALLLTFDDGYIDNYTVAFPILEEYGFQGSFFIPGKTIATHQLLDVNKIHYILASTSDLNQLVSDLKLKMNYYRGLEYDYPSTDQLWNEYAIENRFDNKETIFIKRILQTVLPEHLRNRIASELFKEYVGITEEQLAYELYMTPEQIKVLRKHGMYIGIHGYDHYWLGKLPPEKMRTDINKALEVMDCFIDRKQWVMNYPYGNYNDEVLNYIKKEGAVLGLTTDARMANLDKDSLLELPRLDCNDFPPKSDRYLWLSL